MKEGAKLFMLALIFLSFYLFLSGSCHAEETLFTYCFGKYQQEGICPEDSCKLYCLSEEARTECEQACLPKECTQIPIKKCPLDFCAVLQNCSGERVCHDRQRGAIPKCGDVAYSGQDVACCAGLVRRCGVQFFEGHCDMEGKGSIYSLPICIPCGNGICEQFEDRCNCPEDCGGGIYQGRAITIKGKKEDSARQNKERVQETQMKAKEPPQEVEIYPEDPAELQKRLQEAERKIKRFQKRRKTETGKSLFDL